MAKSKRELASGHLLFTILYPRIPHARVVKWQTRTFEGRMPQGMGVQVPPRAPIDCRAGVAFLRLVIRFCAP